MKQKLVIFLLLLFVLLPIGISAKEIGRNDKLLELSRIDSDIYEELGVKSVVPVVVTLRDPSLKSISSSTTRKGKLELFEKQKKRYLPLQSEIISTLNNDEVKDVHLSRIGGWFAANVTKKGLEKLRANHFVSRIDLITPIKFGLDQSVPLINADKLHSLGYTGKGTTVCVIDSGVDYTNPALGGCFGTSCKVIGGFDFTTNTTNVIDTKGHGTHVSGIIASEDSTYTGVAPDAKLVVVKVNEDMPGLGDGIDWCVSNSFTYGIDVITASIWDFGRYNATKLCKQTIDAPINRAFDVGVPFVSISGNSGFTDGISYPACSPKSIAVGASDDFDEIWLKTNRNERLDLLAPGVGVTGPGLGGGAVTASGTSLAAPHVAGVVALMKQVNPNLNPDEILQALKSSGVPVFDSGTGLTFPRVDAAASIEYVKSHRVGDVVNGFIAKGQVWQANLDLASDSNLSVNLSWSGPSNLDLRLISPSNVEYSSSPTKPKSIFVEKALKGKWKIKVLTSAPFASTQQAFFSITTSGKPVLGGVNFSEVNLNYVSACEAGRLNFVVKGKEGDGVQSFSLEEAQARSLKYFKTGLSIPNYKQWISLPIGGVDVDPVFARTEVAKVMLEQDARMKNSTLPEICTVWSAWNAKWDALVDASQYASEIRGSGYHGYPQGWVRFAITNDYLNASGDACTVYIKDFTPKVEMSALDTPIYLDFSGYNFRPEVASDLNSRLLTWRQDIHQLLNNVVRPKIQYDVSNNEDFKPIRELYPVIAIAQWYKKLPRENLPFADLIDSQNLEGLEAAIPFDRDYWAAQSDQLFTYNATCGMRGGVMLASMQTQFNGVLGDALAQAVDEAVQGSVTQFDGSSLFGGAVEQGKADLMATSIWINQSIEAGSTERAYFSVNNFGSKDAGAFTVQVLDEYTNLQGVTATAPMHVESVAGLVAGGFAEYSFDWNSEKKVGEHKLKVEADYGNQVSEGDESNNKMELSFSVYSPFPEASISFPVQGSSFTFRDNVLFSGGAFDGQDSELEGAALEWKSSINGVIGHGASFRLSNLSAGSHSITFTATDSDGNADVKQVGILVEKAKPLATINYPDGQVFYKPDGVIVLNGSASDREDGELHGISLAWNSSLEGVLGTGELLELNAADLATGTHELTLTATDSEGLKGTDENYFIVVPVESKSSSSFADNSTNATQDFNVEEEQFLYLNISRNAKIASASLELTGLGTGSSFNLNSEYAPDSLTGGLWHFNEPSGVTASDSSGNANHLTATGEIQVVDCKFGKCRNFQAVKGAYMEQAFGSEGLKSPVQTFEAWVYARSFDKNAPYPNMILSKYGPSAIGRQIYLLPDGRPGALGDPGTYSVMGPAIPLNEWTHLAAVFDANNSRIKLYVNGELVGVNSNGAGNFSTESLQVGRFQAADNAYFDGLIEEARISSGDRGGDYAKDPYLDVGNDFSLDWQHEGAFSSSELVDFKDALQAFIGNPVKCGRQSPYCTVPLRFHSTGGKLVVENLSVQYLETDSQPPIIYSAQVEPTGLHPGDNAKVTAFIYENDALERATVEIGGSVYALAFNYSTTFYDAYSVDFVAGAPGAYEATVHAVDENNLTASIPAAFSVVDAKPDFHSYSEYFSFEPGLVSENQPAFVKTIVENFGEENASNVSIALIVDGEVEDEQRLDFAAGERKIVSLLWGRPLFGARLVEIRADFAGEFGEESEDNNNANASINVTDLSGPATPDVTVSPENWSSQRGFVVSWNALQDNSGISRYEYSVDFGEWAGSGLGLSAAIAVEGQGIHIVRVRGVDNSGNYGQEGFAELKVDETAPNSPVVVEKRLREGEWNAFGSPLFEWGNPGDYGSGVMEYVAQLDGEVIGLQLNQSYSPLLGNGEHLFKVRAVDALGLKSQWSNEVTVRVDLDAPEAPVVVSPTHADQGAWYSPNSSLLEWAAPVDLSGVQGFYYWIDQNASFEPSPSTFSYYTTNSSVTVDSPPKGITFNAENASTGLPGGAWFVHVAALDGAGNKGATTHYKLNIDSTPPTTTDDSDSMWHTGSYSLILSPLDMLSGVDKTYYEINGSEPTTSSPQGTSIGFPATGEYAVKYYSIDRAGNRDEVRTAGNAVKIDATLPVVGIVEPAKTTYLESETLQFNYSAFDGHSGVASVQATFDGLPVDSGSSLQLAGKTGTHEFRLKAVDAVGNIAEALAVITVGEEQLVLSPKELKEAAVAELEAAKTGDKKLDKRIEQAVKPIRESLAEKLWAGADSLEKGGQSVFTKEATAANRCANLLASVPACASVLEKLVGADRLLAQKAVGGAKSEPVLDNKNKGRVEREISAAQAELGKAETELGKGNHAKSVGHFKKSWAHAQKAIALARKTPKGGAQGGNANGSQNDTGNSSSSGNESNGTTARLCQIKATYFPDVQCAESTIVANSDAELDAYLLGYGFNGKKYQNLKINYDVDRDNIEIHSPCRITLKDNVALKAEGIICLDGRNGASNDNDFSVDARSVSLLSELGDAGFGAGSIVNTDSLTVKAFKAAKIGERSTLQVDGPVIVASTGSAASSEAIIRQGSKVEAESVRVEALKSAFIGENVELDAAGQVEVISTGSDSSASAGVRQGAKVSAESLQVKAFSGAFIGEGVL